MRWCRVGPWPDQQQALAALGGAVPPDEVLMQGNNGAGGPEQWYLLKRASIVEGTDFRGAQPSTDQNGQPDITFTLTTEAGDRFYKYTSANVNTGDGDCAREQGSRGREHRERDS